MLYTSDGFSSVKWSVVLGRTPVWGKPHIYIRMQSENYKHTREGWGPKRQNGNGEQGRNTAWILLWTRCTKYFFGAYLHVYIYLYKYTYIYIWSYDYTWFLHTLKNISLLNRGFWHLDCAPLSTPGPGGEDCRWLGSCSKGIQHGTWVNDMKQPWWVIIQQNV